MPDSGKLPSPDSGDFLYYVFVLVLSFAMLVGMLVLATKPLWQ